MTLATLMTLACDEPGCAAIYPMGATNERLAPMTVVRSARADGWDVPRASLGHVARCPDHRKESTHETAAVVLPQVRADEQVR